MTQNSLSAKRLAIQHAGRQALKRKLWVWAARNGLSAAIVLAVVYGWPELDWLWWGLAVLTGVSLVTTVVGHIMLQRRIERLGEEFDLLDDEDTP
ncbi:MAG: hypothetical protein AAF615_08520 [Pseudomonadota bacterium]